MQDASVNTIIMLDDAKIVQHQGYVETQQEFLGRLVASGATQAAIGKVLGIAQSNAATFFNPGANGKLRHLKMDEAVKLAEAFGLSEAPLPVEPEPPRLDPDTIAPILGALLPAVDPDHLTDPVLRALSGAFAYGLELLGDQTSSPASPDAIRVAARGAVSRFRELGSA